MLSKKMSININELAEAIRQQYSYESVSIDKIFTGARLTDMKTVELGPGAILDMQITIREKEKNPLKDIEDAIKILKGDKKPLCTEICADPDLVEVIDSRKETEEVRQREQERIANCPLKKIYRCRF